MARVAPEETDTFAVLPHNFMKDNEKELYMEEEWRDISGWEGLYQVSNLGQVRSIFYHCSHKTRIMIQGHDKNGYCRVCLKNNGNRRYCTVHRLVAEAFIPNPNNLPQINHKDECKTNNAVENLEWCDAKHNNNYGTRDKRISETRMQRNILGKEILQYDMNGVLLNKWKSINEAMRAGYSGTCIVGCAKGRYKKHKGYVWKYA